MKNLEKYLMHRRYKNLPKLEGLNNESEYVRDCIAKMIRIDKDTMTSSDPDACRKHILYKTIEVKQELIDAIFKYDIIDILVFECFNILCDNFEHGVPYNRRGKVHWIIENWKAKYWNGELFLS
jgi:hypothetical protein